MKEGKGFTLIELLAVIVILAIIALISTPIIIGVIDKARKGAFEDSAYGVLDAGRLYVINKIADDNAFTGETFDFSRNVDHLKLSGEKPSGGELVLDKNGRQSLAIWDTDKRWCAYKSLVEEELKIIPFTEETCVAEEYNAAIYIKDKNTNNNMEGLFTDDFKNVRYRESNQVVRNYVQYNNETWRIIGVFGNRVKLIRNAYLPNPTNSSTPNTHVWSTSRNNGWSTASVSIYLNGDYYNSFSADAKKMVADATYYLGKTIDKSPYKNNVTEFYKAEQGLNDVTVPTWTGKIGLMYPSDYIYGVGVACASDSIVATLECKSNNWFYEDVGNGFGTNEWTMSPSHFNNSSATALVGNGLMGAYFVSDSRHIRPVLFLDATVKIIAGEGTSENPYQLGV